MSAAVTTGAFTLGGVIVGGLINGGVTAWLARSKDTGEIKVAARLSVSDLHRNGLNIAEAINRSDWDSLHGPGTIRLDRWEQYRELFARLHYDDWVNVWVGHRTHEYVAELAAANPGGARITPEQATKLEEAMNAGATASVVLTHVSIAGRQRQRVRRWLRRLRWRVVGEPNDDDALGEAIDAVDKRLGRG